ncbi:MAG TPA: hypothetical protein VGQ00_00475 [Candidatus Norongarragalinales archaeon]|jgi:ribosomal protein L21E|nr:hypothetical protein [Candidatus Norongarragalinales archaeon]
MVKRSHGFSQGHTRNLRSKGKVPITKHLREFAPGTKLRIDIDPRFPRAGIPLTFNKRVVTILAKRGRSYECEFMDGNKRKTISLIPAHLEEMK